MSNARCQAKHPVYPIQCEGRATTVIVTRCACDLKLEHAKKSLVCLDHKAMLLGAVDAQMWCRQCAKTETDSHQCPLEVVRVDPMYT